MCKGVEIDDQISSSRLKSILLCWHITFSNLLSFKIYSLRWPTMLQKKAQVHCCWHRMCNGVEIDDQISWSRLKSILLCWQVTFSNCAIATCLGLSSLLLPPSPSSFLFWIVIWCCCAEKIMWFRPLDFQARHHKLN